MNGAFVVSDNHELGVFGKLLKEGDEAVDVGFVKGCIHFIEDAEGAGLDFVNCEEEGDCCQRLLTA